MTPISFFDNMDAVKARLGEKEVFLFLDYDGTLTPIVATPDLAIISDEMRKTVQAVSAVKRVSIVSGRATEDVRSKVKIDGIFYAGSHGFEIVHPDGQVTINEEARKIKETVDEIHEALSQKVAHIKGALIEHVKYTVSCHYRLVADEDFVEFERCVDEELAKHENLRKTNGKKVFELRPKIDWDKGKAVQFILDVLGFDQDKHVAIYVGDDTTDEDAFRVLEGKGFGILVADPARESGAEFVVPNVDAVKDVLLFFK